VIVKLGSTTLGSATIVGLDWSYSWTPQSGDIGAQTINATATSTEGATGNAAGVAVTVVSNASPLTIISSVPVRLWLRADLGVTIATGVSSWVDQANSVAFTQATGGAQPTRNAADSSLNNQATISGDGVNDYLSGAPTIAASYWRCSVAKYNASAVNDRLLDSVGHCTLLGQGSPNVVLFEQGGSNTSANNGFGSTGTWKRVLEQQSNATTDRLKIGSVPATGTALGRTASSSTMTIFAGAAAFFANGAFAEIIITDGIPTPTEQTNIDTYLTNRYLASILT